MNPKVRNYKEFYTKEYFLKNYYKNGAKKSFFSPERKYIERDKDIFNLLNPQKNDILLELGCSDGTTSYKLSKFVKKVIGIDFAEEAIVIAKKENNAENIEYNIANATNLNFLRDNSIDKIAAVDFFEHIDDDILKKVLKESYRVLKVGGAIAIYTPQRLHWVEIIKHILKTNPEHIAVRTPNQILRIVKQFNFKVDKLYFSPNPYFGLGWIDKIFMKIPLINSFFRFRICLRIKKVK
jgi:ubiquinone/menaquinone biosynthesis C-methylase UbiE